MILIISESSDVSTNHVIEWITKFSYPFFRINWEDKVEIINLQLNSFELKINDKAIINYNDINAVWFRRGELNLFKNLSVKESDSNFMKYLKGHLKVEIEGYAEYLYFLLKRKKHIGSFENLHLNKLRVLNIAIECGLKTPEFTVISNKKALLSFTKEKNCNLITKSSNYSLSFEYKKNQYMTYTETPNSTLISKLPEKFAPSLCQVRIEKKYDIRVFYLDGSTYSMAILSQSRNESKVDFRKYDYKNPNRRLPFNLDNELISKIENLMKSLGLVSGSLDFVLDTSNNYYFLEVNPVGQYGMVEFPCNYNLNQKIAEYLIN